MITQDAMGKRITKLVNEYGAMIINHYGKENLTLKALCTYHVIKNQALHELKFIRLMILEI